MYIQVAPFWHKHGARVVVAFVVIDVTVVVVGALLDNRLMLFRKNVNKEYKNSSPIWQDAPEYPDKQEHVWPQFCAFRVHVAPFKQGFELQGLLS